MEQVSVIRFQRLLVCASVVVLCCASGWFPTNALPTSVPPSAAPSATPSATPSAATPSTDAATTTTEGDGNTRTDRDPEVVEYRVETNTLAFYKWKEVNEAFDRRTTCTNHCFHGGVNGDNIIVPLMAYATARCTCKCPKWCKRTGAVCQLCRASDNPAVPRDKLPMLHMLEGYFSP